ncbi:MAG: PAS domain-containing protein, partial [Planctomycetota bacterium]
MPDCLQPQPEPSDNEDYASGPDALQLGLLKSILQSLPLAVVTFDSDLRITEANPQATTLIRLDEYIDRALSAGTDNPTVTGLDWTEKLNSIMVAGRTHNFESITYTLNGRTRILRLLCTPLRKPDSEAVLGGTLIIEDITENLDTQRKLANFERFVTVGKLTSKVAHEL